ncbi:hypothetical protein HS961_13435 [Comamonas piscis]|uniref:Uncharacterized protein n=1 Tax=Comamonas piscis TaxID=1562974 RepID=A0A7G5EIC4_9BURK|nr:hypothetical protein [Comamonas piscis]QMV73749.1 hypothetical protein HS961_13435 [Comamonas piscis]WSO32173.1 hypothetical protein VUJ63_13475 [Comamonas piscis]
MTLYDPMIGALREHWKANANAYPQCFELTKVALDDLNADRALLKKSIGLKPLAGGDFMMFHGAKIVIGDSNAMVSKDGTRVPLG